jgi:restriction system protein
VVGGRRRLRVQHLRGDEAHFRSIEEYSEYSSSHLSINTGQLFRFAHEISTGDLVLTYDKTEREYLIGEMDGEYEWEPDDHPAGYPHMRRVEWKKTVSRDDFSTPTKNTLGSSLTVFNVEDRVEEISGVLGGERPRKHPRKRRLSRS